MITVNAFQISFQPDWQVDNAFVTVRPGNCEHLKYLENVYCVMTITAKIKTRELGTKPQTN